MYYVHNIYIMYCIYYVSCILYIMYYVLYIKLHFSYINPGEFENQMQQMRALTTRSETNAANESTHHQIRNSSKSRREREREREGERNKMSTHHQIRNSSKSTSPLPSSSIDCIAASISSSVTSLSPADSTR